MGDYNSTARALALPIDDPVDRRSQSISPAFHRRSQSLSSRQQQSFRSRFVTQSSKLQRQALKSFNKLSPLQRILLIAFNIFLLVGAVLFLIYNERVFGWLAPLAKRWKGTTGGWVILWLATFLVSFPPLIGYSSCVTLAGFVYGVPEGWAIVASATILGSTASFLVSRTVLQKFVSRLTANDKRFAALSLVLKHDGIKLLCMIRLCPLPYSLSNGAISTIPTVQWPQFMLATAIASPKLLLHVFVGSRLGAIAKEGSKMDAKTKAISYISILIGVAAGIATGYFMYTRTKARAAELEADEREAAIRGEQDVDIEAREGYLDDPTEREAVHAVRDGEDDISLHRARDEGYRDTWSDEEDDDPHDVFRHGDGDEEEGFRDHDGGK